MIKLVDMNGVRQLVHAKIFLAAVLVRLTALKHVFQQVNAATLIILKTSFIAMVSAKHLLAVELMKSYVTLVMGMYAGMMSIVATLILITGVQRAEIMELVFLKMNSVVQ